MTRRRSRARWKMARWVERRIGGLPAEVESLCTAACLPSP